MECLETSDASTRRSSDLSRHREVSGSPTSPTPSGCLTRLSLGVSQEGDGGTQTPGGGEEGVEGVDSRGSGSGSAEGENLLAGQAQEVRVKIPVPIVAYIFHRIAYACGRRWSFGRTEATYSPAPPPAPTAVLVFFCATSPFLDTRFYFRRIEYVRVRRRWSFGGTGGPAQRCPRPS